MLRSERQHRRCCLPSFGGSDQRVGARWSSSGVRISRATLILQRVCSPSSRLVPLPPAFQTQMTTMRMKTSSEEVRTDLLLQCFPEGHSIDQKLIKSDNDRGLGSRPRIDSIMGIFALIANKKIVKALTVERMLFCPKCCCRVVLFINGQNVSGIHCLEFVDCGGDEFFIFNGAADPILICFHLAFSVAVLTAS